MNSDLPGIIVQYGPAAEKIIANDITRLWLKGGGYINLKVMPGIEQHPDPHRENVALINFIGCYIDLTPPFGMSKALQQTIKLDIETTMEVATEDQSKDAQLFKLCCYDNGTIWGRIYPLSFKVHEKFIEYMPESVG